MHYLSLMDLPSLKTLNLNKNQIGRGTCKDTQKMGDCRKSAAFYCRDCGSANSPTSTYVPPVLFSRQRHHAEWHSGILRERHPGAQLLHRYIWHHAEVIRNCFSFQDIKEDIQKHNIFCNYFSE